MAGYRGKDLSYLKIGSDILTNTKADLAITIANSEISVRDDDSSGYDDAIVGDGTATISASFNYQKEADGASAQLALIAAAYSQADTTVEWAYETGTGIANYTGTVFVTNLGSTNGDPQSMSFSLRVKTKPIIGVQA